MGIKFENGNAHAPVDLLTWRESMGYSLDDASQMLGVTPAELIRWEKHSTPTPRYITLACAALALGIKA